MMLDVGNSGQSVMINTLGQSANFLSSHYRDLAIWWAAGGYAPPAYSREAVEQVSCSQAHFSQLIEGAELANSPL